MKNIVSIVAIAVIVVLIGLFLTVFTVTEGHETLTLRLGELTKNSTTGKVNEYGPGLHFKAPFITRARTFDVRLQTLNVESSRILTAEQKSVLVDYYAKWRIADLPLYFKRTGGYPVRAQQLLQQKINDSLRAAFGRRTIKEVISGERLNIMDLLQEKANESAKGLGIKVVDVRIQAIDLPQEVRDSVYQRMSSEREQVASKLRSQGKAQAEAIKAGADAKVVVMLAQTKAKAQKIRADGDSKAAIIYTGAYSKNPGFYSFYRSLEAYRNVFDSRGTVMVLKPNSEFFKYFTPHHKVT